jgi:hypothetical protein
MKSLLLPLAAAAALSGCAYYGDPYYGAYGSPGYGYPAYGYPSVNVGVDVYDEGHRGRAWDGRGRGGRGWRDRDGDGVPNRVDARPRDPRWR